MKQIVEELIRRYFRISMILKNTIITERRGKVTINIFDDIAPHIWNMYEQGSINSSTGLGKLDIIGANRIQDTERNRIASQIFDLTLAILGQQSFVKKLDVKKQWDEEYGSLPPKGDEGHQVLINYSIGALFFVNVLTPFDYDITEPAFDESGKLLYIKQLPKPKTDELTETIGSFIGVENENK